MSTLIYWFRHDLRLADNPAFMQASREATHLLPVYCHAPQTNTAWDFARVGVHRQHFLRASLADLSAQLRARGSGLIELHGKPEQLLPALARRIGASGVVCEAISAPEEQAEVAALRTELAVDAVWQSSLLEPADLPFAMASLPAIFTTFRHAVEKHAVLPHSPLAAPVRIAPMPALAELTTDALVDLALSAPGADGRSSFPYHLPAFAGGERAASSHLARYFSTSRVHTYKQTRNDLSGTDYSSKFSPWLANGSLSARSIYVALKRFEAQNGASDGSYWLWFELLWRDYFRFLHLQHGAKLYAPQGLGDARLARPTHNARAMQRWCRGETGEPIVDAGMRDLAATGYLSNRLRQIVASYLIHDLACDWRAGAAWFESQLIDYDVYSNQGNWLYIAGRGTDPRGGRRFDPQKQARDYDPKGLYQALWD